MLSTKNLQHQEIILPNYIILWNKHHFLSRRYHFVGVNLSICTRWLYPEYNHLETTRISWGEGVGTKTQTLQVIYNFIGQKHLVRQSVQTVSNQRQFHILPQLVHKLEDLKNTLASLCPAKHTAVGFSFL